MSLRNTHRAAKKTYVEYDGSDNGDDNDDDEASQPPVKKSRGKKQEKSKSSSSIDHSTPDDEELTSPEDASKRMDNSDDELRDNELDDEREELTNFEAGQVLKVHCQDFMCHKKFTIDFGRYTFELCQL